VTRLVVDALAARFGGTAYAAIQTAKHLARAGAFTEVVVVTRTGSIVAEGLESQERLRKILLPAASSAELPRRLAWEAIALSRDVRKGGPASVLTWSGMLPWRLPVRTAAYICNPLMFESDRIVNRLRRRAMARTARGGTSLLAPSSAMATLASDALEVPVAVVPFGVDHERFSPAPEPGDELLCVADFYPHKRHDIVLEAWAALPPPRPTLRLIGDQGVPNTAYRGLVDRINRIANLGTVRFDQHLPLPELIAAYRRARVFVIASEHESFCMPLLEALACGVPAIARDLPSLRDTGGPATRFLADGDVRSWAAQLSLLLTQEEAHRQARERGLEHAATFAWERTTAKLLDVVLRRDRF
jgi:glycosyltransferase involved in cell wall biosynthesis